MLPVGVLFATIRILVLIKYITMNNEKQPPNKVFRYSKYISINTCIQVLDLAKEICYLDARIVILIIRHNQSGFL